MTLQKIRLGTNEDGSPHHLFISDDPTKPVVITGPIQGKVKIQHAGQEHEYDVNEWAIEADHPEHAGLIAHEIGVRHEREGTHPLHSEQSPFVHTCTLDHCGEAAREGALTVEQMRAKLVGEAPVAGGDSPSSNDTRTDGVA